MMHIVVKFISLGSLERIYGIHDLMKRLLAARAKVRKDFQSSGTHSKYGNYKK